MTGRGSKSLRGVLPVPLTALCTSIPSATLPRSRECVTSHGLSKNPVLLVIPLGSTVNMNGTAVYQGVSTIFLAQVYGVDMAFADYVLVALTAAMATVEKSAKIILVSTSDGPGQPLADICKEVGLVRFE